MKFFYLLLLLSLTCTAYTMQQQSRLAEPLRKQALKELKIACLAQQCLLARGAGIDDKSSVLYNYIQQESEKLFAESRYDYFIALQNSKPKKE